jgi:hypothetical protein
MSGVLYVLQSLIVALALATWAVAAPVFVKQRALVRALLGAALTPFVVGTLVLLTAAAWPGSPPVVMASLPLALALVLLLARRDILRWLAGRLALRARRWAKSGDGVAVALALAATILLTRVAFVVLSAVGKPLIDHDALIYLNAALHFATHRTLDAIPDFEGKPWDVIAGDPHGFLYQAFLAHALLAGDLHDPGFPRDLPARLAFQLTFVFLLVAIAGACALFRRRGAIAAGLLLTFAVGPLQHISQVSSRDAFRVIPLIALAVVLCAPLGRTMRRETGWLILCAILVAWSISAHTLNLFAVPALVSVVVLVYLKTGVAPRTTLRWSLSIGCFAALASWRYVRNYLETGDPLGYGMYYRIYEGTPLAQAFRENRDWNAASVSILEGFQRVFAQFGYPISILACLAATLCIAGVLSGRYARWHACFAGYFVVTLVLPLTGLLDGVVNLRGAMLNNVRYPLGSYTFVGVVCAPLLLRLVTRVDGRGRALLLRLPVVAFVVGISAWALRGWVPRDVPPHYWAAMFPVIDVDQARGEHWITSDNRVAYYHPHSRPIFLYTKPARVLLTATTEEEVWRILDEWRVRAVALDRRVPGWWSHTALFKALTDSPRVTSDARSFLEVYSITPSPEQHHPVGRDQ